MNDTFRRVGKKVLSTARSDRLTLLVPSDGSMQEAQQVESIAQLILQMVQDKLKPMQVHIGWGSPFDQLPAAKQSLEQAELALKVAMTSGKKRYFGYESLGFYKVLFNVSNRKELESFRSEVLGPLN